MCKSADITDLIHRHIGQHCSAHFDFIHGIVSLKWASVYHDAERAEMMGDAATAGEVYGVRFAGIRQYRADNQENLQVGELEEFMIDEDAQQRHAFIRFDVSLMPYLGGVVEFDFQDSSVLVAPDDRVA